MGSVGLTDPGLFDQMPKNDAQPIDQHLHFLELGLEQRARVSVDRGLGDHLAQRLDAPDLLFLFRSECFMLILQRDGWDGTSPSSTIHWRPLLSAGM